MVEIPVTIVRKLSPPSTLASRSNSSGSPSASLASQLAVTTPSTGSGAPGSSTLETSGAFGLTLRVATTAFDASSTTRISVVPASKGTTTSQRERPGVSSIGVAAKPWLASRLPPASRSSSLASPTGVGGVASATSATRRASTMSPVPAAVSSRPDRKSQSPAIAALAESPAGPRAPSDAPCAASMNAHMPSKL